MKTKPRFAGFFLCTMASAMSFASAATISVNFNTEAGRHGQTVAGTAGVVAVGNWTNLGGGPTNDPTYGPYSASALVNSAGATTTAAILAVIPSSPSSNHASA